MFDHFLINYVGNVLVILLALLTYLLYVAHKESMSKIIRVIGCYFYYPMVLITISASFILIYQVEKELTNEDVNRLVESGYITDDVALIIQEKMKARLERSGNNFIYSSIFIESPESISSITYAKVKSAIAESKSNESNAIKRAKRSKSLEDAKLKAQELERSLNESLGKQKVD